MSSRSASSSCLGSIIGIIAALILIRYGLPELWLILGRIFSTALYAGLAFFAVLIVTLGFVTYRNFQRNKQRAAAPPQSLHISRVQELYKSVTDRLQREALANEVSAEEYLQSQILVDQNLNDWKLELIRLKDSISEKNERALNRQVEDYKRELQKTGDPSVRQVIEENLKLLEERSRRMAGTAEEIRQKEATVDLVYHSLRKVEEDLNLGKPVRRLLPSDVYERFGLTPPRDMDLLPPLTEKSSGTE